MNTQGASSSIPVTQSNVARIGLPLQKTQTKAELSVEEKHEQSEFVLNHCTLKWPSISEIQKASNDWTIQSVKARINEIKAEHRSQLAKAVKYLKAKEQASLEEFYSICDELEPWSSSDVHIIKGIYGMDSRLLAHKSEDFIILIRHLHIETLKPLYSKLRELQIVEDRARQQRAKIFPKTTQAWREMDTKDAKLAVARFLMLDKRQQEDHLIRNQTWKDTKADVDYIRDEYEKNIVFAHEVKMFVKDNETTDPRKKT